MASSRVASLFVLLTLPCVALGDTQGKFLGSSEKMNTKLIQAELQGVLNEVLGHGHGVDSARLDKIRNELAPMFKALPKNKKGNVVAQVMRYTVRRYFSQRHAWIVKGFEPHADIMNVSGQDEDILKDKIPNYIRSVLEDRFRDHGFAFEDTVAMVAAIERLAFDEVVQSVEHSFHLNFHAYTDILNRDQLMEVLSSYLIIEMLEGSHDYSQHRLDKEKMHERYPNWDAAYTFISDIVSSEVFERRHAVSPFAEKEAFTFEDVVKIAELISEQFGPWSNHECHEMRDMLTQLDVHKTGRVRIQDFYKSTVEGAWQFLEPTQFLRENGALDESSAFLGPQVLIANYIAGMSNCITSATYYSICCLNDCDQVYRHIEALIPAPTASTSQIIEAVATMHQAPTLTAELKARLAEIAQLHDGELPIHGRLFAQWLHFVFPHECPYPHIGGVSPKTQLQWRAQVGDEAESVTEEEIKQHFAADYGLREASPNAGKGMWVFKEALMESSAPSDASPSFSRMFTLAAMLSMVGAFGYSTFKEIRRLVPQKMKSVEYDV